LSSHLRLVPGIRGRSAVARSLVGPAGEHFVLYRLHSLGLLASLAPANAPVADILVLSLDETVVAKVQVKTRTYGSDGGWHMSRKHEKLTEGRLFYAFLDLEPEHPVSYIVPSSVVADVLRKAHAEWLATPGLNGRAHRDHEMRRLLPAYSFEVPGYPNGWLEGYRENWTSLISSMSSSSGPA
jgi:hypothetical protein